MAVFVRVSLDIGRRLRTVRITFGVQPAHCEQIDDAGARPRGDYRALTVTQLHKLRH
jgi:hypothetical protein